MKKLKSLVCPQSGHRVFLTHSEIRNEQYFCGRCGERIVLPLGEHGKPKLENGREHVVPYHKVPDAVTAYRANLKLREKDEM